MKDAVTRIFQKKKNTNASIAVCGMELKKVEEQEELHPLCAICQNEACRTGSSSVLKEQKVKACIKIAKQKGVCRSEKDGGNSN